MDLSRFAPDATWTPDEPRPQRWPRWWWARLELSSNTHRSFGHTAPRTRGWLHLAMAVVGWPLLVVRLLTLTDRTPEVLGVLAFGFAMEAMFGLSALFHWKRWGVWTTEALFRLDHTGIFLAIGGSVTPLALIVLDGWARWLILGAAWLAVGVGIVASLAPRETPVGFGNTFFISLGALVVPFLPRIWGAIGVEGVAWLLAGGAVYIVGAVLLAFQKPQLWPRVFGYHEVWHTMVLVGVLCHYVMVERTFLPLA